MKKEEKGFYKIDSLTDAHRLFGLPQPRHPLVSLINGPHSQADGLKLPPYHVLGFYKISYKPKLSGKLKYGQHYYDFDEGGLLFASPGQLIGHHDNDASACSAYTLLIHPDFFLGYPLARTIKQYGFFSYSTHETLHLSEEEKGTILELFTQIDHELAGRIDDSSQNVLIAQIELLLTYANRYYKRQFITRKAVNSDLLLKLEVVVEAYFADEQSANQGLLTVHYLAEQVNLSASYLSDMLRSLIGQNAQQYVHTKLIEKAKAILSTTSLSVGEVAYRLGFEHSQSFSKLFKTKTQLSPLAFRRSFT